MVFGRQITELQLQQQLRQATQTQLFLLKQTLLSLLNLWDKVRALFSGSLVLTIGGPRLHQALHLNIFLATPATQILVAPELTIALQTPVVLAQTIAHQALLAEPPTTAFQNLVALVQTPVKKVLLVVQYRQLVKQIPTVVLQQTIRLVVRST